jgi:hypothetical protein
MCVCKVGWEEKFNFAESESEKQQKGNEMSLAAF